MREFPPSPTGGVSHPRACSYQRFAMLIPRVRPRSRGITDANVVEMMGSRPNVKIMGATQPEALAKYQNADKVLCF